MAKNPSNGFFYINDNSIRVPMALFAKNRERLAAELRKCGQRKSVVLLQGGEELGLCAGDSADVNAVFQQEAFFHWAFGVLEPDFFGAVDVDTGRSILFMPRLPIEYGTWLGDIETTDECKERPAAFDGISTFTTDDKVLYPVICELRSIKTDMELEVLGFIAKVSSMAHKHVMRSIKPGMKEYQCESTFLNYCYYNFGCRHVSYTCICGSGHNGSILHYGHAGAPNDRTVQKEDIVLFDMGATYYGFCSDITCSYPASGKFTARQKLIYNAVLRACNAVLGALKPGVSWKDMHLLANREMLHDLLEGGLLQGNVDDMMSVNLAGRVFQPHGLGHFLGLNVHDVGGYLEGHPERPQGPGLRSLRTARIMEAGMVVTVEPGCYFNSFLIDSALADPELSRFLVADRLEEFRGFGGVRIEEDVAVTSTGCEVMSVVPRTVEEIENWMSGVGEETLLPLTLPK